MSKFKIGDKVVVIEAEDHFLEVGEVCEVIDYATRLLVKSDNPSYETGEWYIDDHKLELYEESKVSGDISVSSELTKVIKLRILDDEYEITVEEARDLISQLQGELNE